MQDISSSHVNKRTVWKMVHRYIVKDGDNKSDFCRVKNNLIFHEKPASSKCSKYLL